MPVTSD